MRPVLPLFLALAACSTASVSGSVGGEPVSNPSSAVYDTYTVETPFGDVGLMALAVTDIKDFCTVGDELLSNIELDCAEQCEDYVRIADESLGADGYYNLVFIANFDPDRVEGEFRLGGQIPAENEFRTDLSRFDTSQLDDEEGCVEWCEAGNPVVPTTDSAATSGSFTVETYDADKEIVEGSFELAFGGDDLTGAFKAERCDAISGWYGLED